MVVELIEDLVRTDRRLKAMKAEPATAVRERGSTLMDLYGIGPAGAARILADVGDVTRFADSNRFASWTGTAPLDASSGEQIRHRLSRAGNRRMNHVIYVAAVVQIRNDTSGREYYRRQDRGVIGHEAGEAVQGCGPGRAQRGDSRIQRGRPAPAHRHFG